MPAPKFDLEVISKTRRGTRIRSDKLGDQVQLLYFWASWCTACQFQSPAVINIAKQFEGKVKVVGINADVRLDIARDAADEKSFPFDSVFDHGGAMQNAYRAGHLPACVIVDKTGKVSYSIARVVGESVLVAEVERALGGN